MRLSIAYSLFSTALGLLLIVAHVGATTASRGGGGGAFSDRTYGSTAGQLLPGAAYVTISNGSNVISCSGSLISPSLILTAAHCFYTVNWFAASSVLSNGASPTISVNLTLTDGRSVLLSTIDYVIHPQFDLQSIYFTPGFCTPILQCPASPLSTLRLSASTSDSCWKLYYDAALILLPMSVSNAPVLLYDQGVWVPSVGQTLSGYGYGITPTRATADGTQQEISLSVLANCSSVNPCNLDSKSQLCVNSTTSSTCLGDSGGPLIQPSTQTVVGIVSFAVERACTLQPTLYSRVSALAPWIKSTISPTRSVSSPYVLTASLLLSGMPYSAWQSAASCFATAFVAALARDTSMTPSWAGAVIASGPVVQRWQIQLLNVSGSASGTRVDILSASFSNSTFPADLAALNTTLRSAYVTGGNNTYLLATLRGWAGIPPTASVSVLTVSAVSSNAQLAATFVPYATLPVATSCTTSSGSQRPPSPPSPPSAVMSASTNTLIIAVVCSIGGCVVLLAIALLTRRCLQRPAGSSEKPPADLERAWAPLKSVESTARAPMTGKAQSPRQSAEQGWGSLVATQMPQLQATQRPPWQAAAPLIPSPADPVALLAAKFAVGKKVKIQNLAPETGLNNAKGVVEAVLGPQMRRISVLERQSGNRREFDVNVVNLRGEVARKRLVGEPVDMIPALKL